VKVMCNRIGRDNAKASDKSIYHDYTYASDNATDRTIGVMLM
jgi:hypothetical protein